MNTVPIIMPHHSPYPREPLLPPSPPPARQMRFRDVFTGVGGGTVGPSLPTQPVDVPRHHPEIIERRLQREEGVGHRPLPPPLFAPRPSINDLVH